MTSIGHQYGAVSVNDSASLFQGNIQGGFHQHFHQSASDVESAQRRKIVADWYSRTDFADQQTDHISRREEGTGRWFLTHIKYLHWIDHANAALFCPGIPGSGKSMMVATVVDDLQTRFAGREDVAIIYLYCNFNRQAEQDICNMLAVLVRQLFQEQTHLPEPVQALYRKHRDRATRPSEYELKNVLRSLVDLYNRVFIVLDALDEFQNACEGRDKFLAELCYLQSQKNRHVNVLGTSRPIPEIRHSFPVCPCIEIRAHHDDLRMYLTSQMGRLARFVSQNEQLQEQIRRQITDAAEGMFLLARLQFDSLYDKLTPRKLKDALARLTKGFIGLNKAYADALNRIENQRHGYRDLARKALLWITYARQELSVEELQEAIAIEPGWEDLDHNEDLTEADTIVSACQGLVEVDQKSGVIRLVHYTTQEYFERVREGWLPNGDLQITRSCLAYLSMSIFPYNRCEWNMDLSSLIEKYKLLRYVGNNWGVHARTVDDQQVCAEILKVLMNKDALCFVGQLALANWNRSHSRYETRTSYFSAIHMCAYFGLKHIVRDVIRNGEDSDARDNYGRTALFWATEKGHIEFVQLLLLRPDIDLGAHDKGNGMTLAMAAKRGYTEIVQQLLARPDTDINIRNRSGQTPLLSAALMGHVKIIQLFLARSDVNVNVQDDYGRSPLSQTTCDGHTEIVKMLLTRPDIEINIQDQDGNSPLSLAAQMRHTEIMQLLLTRPEISVNTRDHHRQTPFPLAAMNHHRKTATASGST